MPGMQMSAGYFVITNNTDKTTPITKVSSPQFEAVEIHETTIADGVSRMRELEALLVPAQSSVVLERGGKHLMLMRPRDLQDSVALQFYSDDLPILSVTYSFPEDERK
jgi:copper(I)-binding protein